MIRTGEYIKDIFTMAVGTAVQARGWVKTRRDSKGVIFIQLNDGSCFKDLQAVVDELSALQRPSSLPDADTPPALIEHIIARYHEVHRAQLPELIRMARRVEAVHRDNPNTPHGLADALETMEQELLMHMHKEEAVLFPMLRAGGNSFVSQPIAMMRHEHNDHGEALEHLASLTNDITPPMGACNTWRALYTGLAQLREDLINHIHLENNILFPQFEQAAQPQGCGGGGCGCA